MRVLGALAVAFVGLSTWGARAAPLLETVGASFSTNPFLGMLEPASSAATYFNPALLPWVDDGVSAGLLFLAQRVTVDYHARDAAVDVPASVYDARRLLADGTTAALELRPLPTDRLPKGRGAAGGTDDRAYMGFGTVKRFLAARLAVAFHALLPVTEVQAQRPFFVDEREQYFSNSLQPELLGDRTEGGAFVLALAGRPLPWLGLGAGLTVDNRSTVRTTLYMPEASDQASTLSNTEVVVRSSVVPHFGLALRPWAGLRLAATCHVGSRSDVDTTSVLRFWTYPYPEGADSLTHSYTDVQRFEPLRVGFGAGWESDRDQSVAWSAGLVGRWARWSTYLDRHGAAPLEAWADTVSLAGGGSVVWADQRFGLDVAFVPSPVPPQEGRTNYVDTARLGTGFGWEGTFRARGLSFTVGVHGQVQRLLPRSETKRADAAHPVPDEFPESVDVVSGQVLADAAGLQTNNPGYPGYDVSGWLVGVGAVATLKF